MARNLNAARLESCVERVRHFNRFYTRRIGVLREGCWTAPCRYRGPCALRAARGRDKTTATEVRNELDLDAGYLSRILRGFRKRGWIKRTPASDDARRQLVSLTRSGRAAFEPLNARSNEEVRQLLKPLTPALQTGVVHAMQRIEAALEPTAAASGPYSCARTAPATWAGSSPAWSPLFRRVPVRRAVRGVGRADRVGVRAAPRSRPRALLDRGEGRRMRGFGLPGGEVEAGGQAASAAGRAVGARSGNRQAPGRGVRPVRAAMPVPQAGPVDAERAESGEALVRAVGIPIGGQRTPRELGPGTTWFSEDVGARAPLILPQRCVRPAVSSIDDGSAVPRSRLRPPAARFIALRSRDFACSWPARPFR